jgi:hypothetical protein
VFGALKSEARRLFRMKASDDPDLKLCRQDAARAMCHAWDKLGGTALESAWQIFQADEDWGDSDEVILTSYKSVKLCPHTNVLLSERSYRIDFKWDKSLVNVTERIISRGNPVPAHLRKQ